MATFFEAIGGDPTDFADYMPEAAPVVSRMLELSTAHAPDAEAYGLWIAGVIGLTSPNGDVIPTANTAGPDWLQAILLHAEALGCTWVHFDADGPIDPALPFWKW